MRALVIAEPEGPSALSIKDVPPPVPAKGQIVVNVRACGLNRADLLQTLGLYPAPPGYPPDMPGLEYVGVVAKAGGGFKAGERVMGLVPAAAMAEQLVVHPKHVLRVPKNVSDTDAAAFVEAFTTAYDAIWLQGGAKKGSTVLIHAVGSGVGTAAVQLCRAFGCRSVGTSRTKAKLDRAAPDVPVRVGDPPLFAEAVGGADVCLDLVGGHYFAETLDAMKPRGTVMVVGVTGGPSAETPLRVILGKRLRVIGTTLRARDDRERTALFARIAKDVLPLLKSGRLKAVVNDVKPFAEAKAAFEAMAANETYGKTVLTW